ncbi:hypothetical protein AK812_SmicGene22759 [Symbiodinium microadriaticum]|uniref:Uncharacterized protein n=3 Tax=Symbiodinium TaxID=2949 RepID=A0A1Q9DIZ2_SYMMI|nr:hypothetical protein AK812_SmicGene22759 [Symbiodinium microadriaticum]
MTTLSMGPDESLASEEASNVQGGEDGSDNAGLVEMLAQHYFGLDIETPEPIDSAQEAEMASLADWASDVLGGGVVDVDRAVCAARTAGAVLNPAKCADALMPAITAANEAMAKIREFRAEQEKVKHLRQAVSRQAENMTHKLKHSSEQGEITEDDMHRRAKSVIVWQSKKDGELDVKLGNMEPEVCEKTEKAAGLILEAWIKLRPRATDMPVIPECSSEVHPMDVDVDAMDSLLEQELEMGLASDFATEDAPASQPNAVGSGSSEEAGDSVPAPTVGSEEASTEGVVRQPAGKPKGNGAVYAAIDAGLIDQVLSKMCPPEVVEAMTQTKKGTQRLDDLFMQYLQCNGQWLESKVCITAKSKKSKELQCLDSYERYMDLKKKHGAVNAKLIRDEKRALQEALDKDPDENTLPYILAHPDLPGSEDWELIRVFDSAKIVASDKTETESSLTADLQLDLAKEAEELKKLRSEPLRNGYDAELELHRGTLNEMKEKLQASDLEESAEKQEACTAEVGEAIKAYQDAASMIKKKLDLSFAGAAEMLRQGHKEVHTNGGDLGLLGDLIRRAGSNGKHASNIERDVLRTLSKTVGSEVPISYVKVPMLTSVTNDTVVHRMMPVILPHHLLQYLHGIDADQIDMDAARDYWSHVQKHTVLSCGFATIQAYMKPECYFETPSKLESCPRRDMQNFVSECVQEDPGYFLKLEGFHHTMHSQPMFQPKFLRSTDGEVVLAAKGYNARVITSWLADVTTLLVHDEIYQTEELILLAQLMHFCSSLMNHVEWAPRFLNDSQIQGMQELAYFAGRESGTAELE